MPPEGVGITQEKRKRTPQEEGAFLYFQNTDNESVASYKKLT